ncbi:MAG: amidohydrolase [Betaproteobacteria bacterium]|nr:amidohydrolase [Betaproteobacteria bacterium]
MRVITLEDHFGTPMDRGLIPKPVGMRAQMLAQLDERLGYSIDEGLLDLGEMRLAHMDRAGIDFQVISLTQPGAQAYDAATAVPLARDANDRLADACKKHPTRFGGFATLATADPAESVKELERCVTKLGFKGALVSGSTGGEFLDNKKYWGIFECAEALDVPFYIHPGPPHPLAIKAYFEGAVDPMARAAWGFAIDAGTHFLRIAMAGVLDRFPKLTFILGHLGEGIPFVLDRMNSHTERACKAAGLKKNIKEYMCENVMVTTSGNFAVPSLLCTLMTLGADRIMFSVDWPYEKNEWGQEYLKQLPISPEDLAKIAHLNAQRVLKL